MARQPCLAVPRRLRQSAQLSVRRDRHGSSEVDALQPVASLRRQGPARLWSRQPQARVEDLQLEPLLAVLPPLDHPTCSESC